VPRPDGGCEIEPEMPCVWVEAWEGSRRMAGGGAMARVRRPVDHSARGSSAWLRAARASAARAKGGEQAG
jgi:hypothetical protein